MWTCVICLKKEKCEHQCERINLLGATQGWEELLALMFEVILLYKSVQPNFCSAA